MSVSYNFMSDMFGLKISVRIAANLAIFLYRAPKEQQKVTPGAYNFNNSLLQGVCMVPVNGF